MSEFTIAVNKLDQAATRLLQAADKQPAGQVGASFEDGSASLGLNAEQFLGSGGREVSNLIEQIHRLRAEAAETGGAINSSLSIKVGEDYTQFGLQVKESFATAAKGAQELHSLMDILPEGAQKFIGTFRSGLQAINPLTDFLIGTVDILNQKIDQSIDASVRWGLSQGGAVAEQARAYQEAAALVDDYRYRIDAALGEIPMERRTQSYLRLAQALQDPGATEAARGLGDAMSSFDMERINNDLQTFIIHLGNLKEGETFFDAFADLARTRQNLTPDIVVQPTVDIAAANALLGDQADLWQRVTDGTASYSDAVQGLHQQLNSLNEAQRAELAGYDEQIAKINEANSAKERQRQLDNALTSIDRAQADYQRDQELAGDVLSSQGQAANANLESDRRRLDDARASYERLQERYKSQDDVAAIRDDRSAAQESFGSQTQELRDIADLAAFLKAHGVNDITINYVINDALSKVPGYEPPAGSGSSSPASYGAVAGDATLAANPQLGIHSSTERDFQDNPAIASGGSIYSSPVQEPGFGRSDWPSVEVQAPLPQDYGQVVGGAGSQTYILNIDGVTLSSAGNPQLKASLKQIFDDPDIKQMLGRAVK